MKSCFHQCFIYIHKFNKTMAYKENCMVDRCMRMDSSYCDPSCIAFNILFFNTYPAELKWGFCRLISNSVSNTI